MENPFQNPNFLDGKKELKTANSLFGRCLDWRIKDMGEI